MSVNQYSNIFSLKNKTAFILGGKGQIGLEIAKIISIYNAKTIVLDIGNKSEDLSNNIIFKEFDCSNLEEIENNLEVLINEFGCPDIFINTSYPRTKDWAQNSFQDITLDSFKKNMDMHLNSYAWVARTIANYMSENKIKGSIIQLGSIYGLLGQDLNIYNNTNMKNNMSYSLIKGAIINLTRQMASVYGSKGIRVNSISPGGILHPSQEKIFIKQYSNKVPLGRMGNANEVATAALFLSSQASSYITGENLVIDGGWKNSGFAGEIISSVVERIDPQTLKRSPIRVTLPDSPAPTSKPLENIYYPNQEHINKVIRQLIS